MIKRVLSCFFTLAALLILLPLTATEANAYYNLITDRAEVDGSDFTESEAMAETLNDIFDGDASIYADKTCTIPVDTYLGTSPVKNNGVSMHVGPEGEAYLNRGTSCYIYANGVYYTLFGEVTGAGEPGENSEMLQLTGSRSPSYERFKAWGVRQGVGALIRASGHSMIVLDYDEQTITILDGNSDGRGRVSICTRSWEKFAKYYYISYIIQPKDSYYADLYGCGTCGESTSWYVDGKGTLTITGSGEISYPGWLNYSSGIKKVIIGEDITGISNPVFYGCKNFEQVLFLGDAPQLTTTSFFGVTATVLFPATERGWTEHAAEPYGGNLTWKPYGMTELKITEQPHVSFSTTSAVALVSLDVEGDGLTYEWYMKGANDAMYVKSSVTGSAYPAKISHTNDDRQIMCVVTDQYGNSVKSESISLCAQNFLSARGRAIESGVNLLTGNHNV